ncbi:MAG TPA: hypothetical protein VGV60_15200 [Candidatus Polarisedimenticolia bacterium]|nr:hypothetical protein [Candidatus Polarisedimenticolia bacterium]
MPPDRPTHARPFRSRPAGWRRLPVAVAAAVALAAWLPACRARPEDQALRAIAGVLRKGDRLIALRAIDPAATRIAAVIGTAAGKPELRIFEGGGGKKLVLAHTASQGDGFKNLALQDVDLDGREEIVVTWEGGHLEMIEVIARDPSGAYRTIFQNAGRQIEARYDAAGRIEFWITSRTYQEGPRQAPDYETTVYRWDKGGYVEAPHP